MEVRSVLALFSIAAVLTFARSQECSELQQSELEGMNGLIADLVIAGDNPDRPSVTINDFQIVCLAAASTRDQYRFVSVVVDYDCSGSPNCIPSPAQFDFQCEGGSWIASLQGSVANVQGTPATGTLTTMLRTNCSFCLGSSVAAANPFFFVVPATVDSETHCAPCSDTCRSDGLRLCTGNTADQCCNFFESDVCEVSCSQGLVPVDGDCLPDPCDANPCDVNADCQQVGLTSNFVCQCRPPFTGDGFTCTRVSFGDDPHFSIVLPNNKILCYTVQGEHGFVFNLISNEKLHMNAMFVPDSRRSEVTWIGSLGIVVQSAHYQGSNVTELKFDANNNQIHIGNKVSLSAKNVDALTFINGKLTISEAPLKAGFHYPSVKVNLEDVGLHFTIKFTGEHLDMFWHSVGEQNEESHGLIGQFFHRGVEIDEVRKLLLLPGKEPVPVMRRPMWSFMEREMKDDQLCWTAMNPGYQGEGLIDGTYFDYLVNDVYSKDFVYKPKGHQV